MSIIEAIEVGHPAGPPKDVPIGQVDAELNRRIQATRGEGLGPVRRVRMSNLIIYCSRADHACAAEAEVPRIVAYHPARVLLLVVDPAEEDAEVRASVLVRQVAADARLVSEQVTLRAGGRAVEKLAFAVRSLLIGDLPTNLWWASSTPPPLASPILDALADQAQQVIYDSLGWVEPNRGVAATSSWLGRFERDNSAGRWRIASDLTWRRLKAWRRLLSQGLDPCSAPGMLGNISEVIIEHGPHAVTQAWQVAGWLASRLGWTYNASRIRPNLEIAFQFRTPNGPVVLRIDRLADGPSEIRRVRILCGFEGQDGVLDFAVESADRLVVTPQGVAVQPRTVAIPSRAIGDLIGRQLSDREPDPVFRETMKVAQRLAERVA